MRHENNETLCVNQWEAGGYTWSIGLFWHCILDMKGHSGFMAGKGNGKCRGVGSIEIDQIGLIGKGLLLLSWNVCHQSRRP